MGIFTPAEGGGAATRLRDVQDALSDEPRWIAVKDPRDREAWGAFP